MQNNKKSQNIRCWKCGKIFSFVIDTTGKPTLTLSCPHCYALLTVNLAAYPGKVITVMVVAGEQRPKEKTVYELPDVLESEKPSLTLRTGIPLPIVRLNRFVLLSGVCTAIIIQQPVIITLLFFIILGSVVFGKKGNLIFIIGSRLFTRQSQNILTEDPKLMSFSNLIATILLGCAQIAFFLGSPLVGWILSGFVAITSAIALAGFSFGYFVFYQFNLQRFRIFGR